jgi:hypothetical protein
MIRRQKRGQKSWRQNALSPPQDHMTAQNDTRPFYVPFGSEERRLEFRRLRLESQRRRDRQMSPIGPMNYDGIGGGIGGLNFGGPSTPPTQRFEDEDKCKEDTVNTKEKCMELMETVEDIKEKISDAEYKNLLDKLMTLHNGKTA